MALDKQERCKASKTVTDFIFFMGQNVPLEESFSQRFVHVDIFLLQFGISLLALVHHLTAAETDTTH